MQIGVMEMNNYECYLDSQRALAEWLHGRLCCDACPMERECHEGSNCAELLAEWMKREVKNVERKG